MARFRREGILALLGAAALTAALGAAGADAKKSKKKTPSRKAKVALAAPTSTQFSVTLTSKFKPCVADRVVDVFYTDPQGDLASVPLAVDRTNKKGKVTFYLPAAAYTGSYSATAEVQKIRARGGPQQCKAATSGAVTVA